MQKEMHKYAYLNKDTQTQTYTNKYAKIYQMQIYKLYTYNKTSAISIYAKYTNTQMNKHKNIYKDNKHTCMYRYINTRKYRYR